MGINKTEKQVLLDVQHLKKYFEVGKNQTLKAVDDVTLQIFKGETLGLVGESGCGKSTFGRTVIHLYEPTSGTVTFDGMKVDKSMSRKQAHELTGRMQMIFQDPYASLNPRRKIMDIVGEGLDAHGLAKNRKDKEEQVVRLLETVGLQAEHADRFPHEFSGGQRQRVGIARALAVNPDFIVCDEPISALDVSIQAQVVNLLEELQEKRGLTYLFIAHDLSVVRHISNRIGVMYLGSLVELGESYELNRHPIHPYTQTLLSAVPVPDPTAKRERILLEGSIPSAHKPPTGCKFHTRCPKCMECCKTQAPERYEVDDGHYVYCHLYDKERREQQK